MRFFIPLAAGLMFFAALCSDTQPNATPTPPQDQTSAPQMAATDRSLLEDMLLRPDDLGPSWKDAAAEAGFSYPTPETVAPVGIDPGLETPEQACAVANLLGVPDGVKTEVASSSLISDDQSRGGYLVSSAALFPSEENAIARLKAYDAAIRSCPREMELTFADKLDLLGWPHVAAERLELAGEGLALRHSVAMGGFFRYGQVNAVVRHGRVIAALYISEFGGELPDREAERLIALLADRVIAGSALVFDSSNAIPLWHADPDARASAFRALSVRDDYPLWWNDEPPPITVEIDGVITTTSQGGRMFIMSSSQACTASELHAKEDMLGRAGTGLMKVGYDHYVWHSVAVYESEDAARDAEQAVIDAKARCSDEYESQRTPDFPREWTSVEIAGFEPDDHIHAGIERWGPLSEASRNDAYVSTDLSAVIRRGRVLMTLSYTGPGEDIPSAEEALRITVKKLEAAVAD